jgi:SAM-dependent methyltransferase
MGKGGDYVSLMEEQFFSEDFINSHDWFQHWLARRRATRQLRDITKYKVNGELLEIGPGAGEFLNAAMDLGFRCCALDMSETVTNHVMATTGVETRVGSFQDIESWGRKFDVIVMSHVLEHSNDPAAALRVLHSAVYRDSIAYVAVPNLASWPAAFSGWKCYLPYHLYYFTPKTLRNLFESNGFELLTISTFQDAPSWAVTLARSMVKQTGVVTRAPVGECRGFSRNYPKAFLNLWNWLTVCVGYSLTPLHCMQNLFSRGDELIALARPKSTSNVGKGVRLLWALLGFAESV